MSTNTYHFVEGFKNMREVKAFLNRLNKEGFFEDQENFEKFVSDLTTDIKNEAKKISDIKIHLSKRPEFAMIDKEKIQEYFDHCDKEAVVKYLKYTSKMKIPKESPNRLINMKIKMIQDMKDDIEREIQEKEDELNAESKKDRIYKVIQEIVGYMGFVLCAFVVGIFLSALVANIVMVDPSFKVGLYLVDTAIISLFTYPILRYIQNKF